MKRVLSLILALTLTLALAACGGLLMTGPTGTNVNDVAVALLRG